MKSIGKEEALKMLRQMLVCRRFEEACLKGYQQKHITGFCHTYIGQEAVAVGTLNHLTEEDSFVTSYRCHAQGLVRGMSAREIMAEMYGKVTGCVRGKGGSMHVFSKELNHLGGHGIVGGQIPVGTGAAFAGKYEGKKVVNITYFGDGASAQGTFHESVNLAALWDIPCIYICENNQYGMGTATKRAVANTDIQDQAAGYGIKGYEINGLDAVEVYTKMKDIIAEVRETSRPVIINMVTYRYKGHSVSDAGLYRTKDEVKSFMDQDCINRFSAQMQELGWIDEDAYKALDKEVKAEIKDAVKFAEDSPWPPLDEVATHVLA
ncbi:MAG: pyruvate dehydrogenase (acetyl-transferring) E1 component subunit alpha [Lentisphaeraceae bacterium]|nr:pyruvate dehydrogenase (acetyl-transferring) E1 component subunit alpha [Lentisphaeraceae bacterium]